MAALGVTLPGVAQADPILPLPSPSLPLPLPGGTSSPEPILPLPPLPLPGGSDGPSQPSDPTAPVPDNPTSPTNPDGSKPGGARPGQPRTADPADPAGDRYPHPPFAPINGNPSAALLQRLYDAQATQRSLRNQIDTLSTQLESSADAVATTKAELASARRSRDNAAEGVQDQIRTIYKSGAPYAIYTAVGGSDRGVIRDGAQGRLSAITDASEKISYLSDQLAGAVDSRDALTATLTELKRQLAQANAIVSRFQRAAATDIAAGVPNPGVPAGYTGGHLLWPVRGQVTSGYGNRYDPYYHSWQLHAGIDIAAPSGTPVRSSAPGRVVMAGEYGGYGNYICLAHGVVRDQQLTTCYAHLSAIGVREGQSVGAAQAIGRVGSTGASTGPHLHFEVRLGGRPTDPRLWL
ncbi:MAG: peptidoglycan DD-metalloendopeptidase family protein [Micromonosporaceae bacterium]